MKKILFLCAAGMSTSLLVNRTMAAVKKAGKENELTFSASEVSNADHVIPDADCILIAPQIRFRLKDLQKKYPEKRFALIPPQTYGMCDGPAIINLAQKTLG